MGAVSTLAVVLVELVVARSFDSCCKICDPFVELLSGLIVPEPTSFQLLVCLGQGDFGQGEHHHATSRQPTGWSAHLHRGHRKVAA